MKIEKTTTISLPTGVLGLTGTADGSRLYAACMDGRVFEIDPAAKAVTPFAGAHTSYASACVLLPDGRTVISGGYDGCLRPSLSSCGASFGRLARIPTRRRAGSSRARISGGCVCALMVRPWRIVHQIRESEHLVAVARIARRREATYRRL